MGNYNLSTRAQYDLVGIYKYGIKFFGPQQASKYLLNLGSFLEELAERPELAKDASAISGSLKYYSYKAHVIFYQFDSANEIFIVRVLGKRMNFVEHLQSSNKRLHNTAAGLFNILPMVKNHIFRETNL